MPPNAAAQPLSSARPTATPGNQVSAFESTSPASAAPQPEQIGSGVVLRWKATRPAPAATPVAEQSFAADASSPINSSRSSARVPSVYTAAGSSNPLRTTVQAAAFQQNATDPFGNPFGEERPQPPNLPQGNVPGLPDLSPPGSDPLSSPEVPPLPNGLGDEQPAAPLQPNAVPPRDNTAPGSILEGNPPASPFPGAREEASPRDVAPQAPERLAPRSNFPNQAESNELQRRVDGANSTSCNELRSRVQDNPLTKVSLDISPSYGEGLRSVKKDTEEERLDFAASSEVRDWSDYRGYVVARGRLIDLRNGRVVIDEDGTQRTIPFRNLSDVDVAYVGESWHIPERCGMGYEPFVGREHIASTVQWKASGLCHKPLYFEQVQLERYGHEVGPVLQPLISSAHFFGTIPVLPYKMGIHPPNECQYALGYYRPGDCAPYMLPPIPLSLRGAVLQAGAVTGAAALIP